MNSEWPMPLFPYHPPADPIARPKCFQCKREVQKVVDHIEIRRGAIESDAYKSPRYFHAKCFEEIAGADWI